MEASTDPDRRRSGRRRARRSAARARRSPWRLWLVLTGGLLLAAIAVDLPLTYFQSRVPAAAVQSLQATISKDREAGVPAASLKSLERRLRQTEAQPWFSPVFWLQPKAATVAALRQSSTRAFAAAMRLRSRAARNYLTDYRRLVDQEGAWLSSAQAHQSDSWPAQLAKAGTPDAIRALSLTWKEELEAARGAALQTEAAAAAAVSLSTGSSDPLAQASAAEKLALASGVSELAVPAAASALQSALASGGAGTSQSARLAADIQELRAEIGLQQQLGNLRETVMGLVDQAAFEQVPGTAQLQSGYAAAKAELNAARDVSGLGRAQSALRELQDRVQAALGADSCGHSSIPGKSIYISISLEEMVFFDNGCAVNSTAVTAGRPQLPTPTGTYSVFLKQSPVEFISGYAPGSPYYYVPFLAQYAMEFLGGGYYIHNAPWETAQEYGPGSQDNPGAASHGCVHTPLATLAWAYGWTPLGTPVVISA
ncbi:MAG: L,D-transpeptidase family protein [Candidatus Dormibacteria bacterium]